MFYFYLFFFHTICRDHSLNFLHSFHFYPCYIHRPSPPDALLLQFPSEKGRDSRDINLTHITRCNKTIQESSYQGWKRQSNRRKRVSRRGKRVRDATTPTVRRLLLQLFLFLENLIVVTSRCENVSWQLDNTQNKLEEDNLTIRRKDYLDFIQ